MSRNAEERIFFLNIHVTFIHLFSHLGWGVIIMRSNFISLYYVMLNLFFFNMGIFSALTLHIFQPIVKKITPYHLICLSNSTLKKSLANIQQKACIGCTKMLFTLNLSLITYIFN